MFPRMEKSFVVGTMRIRSSYNATSAVMTSEKIEVSDVTGLSVDAVTCPMQTIAHVQAITNR
jgi:hypothetical protein